MAWDDSRGWGNRMFKIDRNQDHYKLQPLLNNVKQ